MLYLKNSRSRAFRHGQSLVSFTTRYQHDSFLETLAIISAALSRATAVSLLPLIYTKSMEASANSSVFRNLHCSSSSSFIKTSSKRSKSLKISSKMDRIGSEKLILVNREADGIAFVTINRPKSLNSLTKSMMADLEQAFKSLDGDDSVKVIVLSGSGRSFCSGVDLTVADEVFKGDVKDAETDPVFQMELCRKPIIGAIGGFAVTVGFEIALACDILIASKGAKFMDTHVRFGIFPSWGLSQKLSRIIGPNKAREVSLAATPLTAEVAEKLGLVNHLVEESELLKKAREVVLAITKKKNNEDLVLRYKSVINDGIKLDLAHALALEKKKSSFLCCDFEILNRSRESHGCLVYIQVFSAILRSYIRESHGSIT